jgi:methylase of polypeptide subunit release factors
MSAASSAALPFIREAVALRESGCKERVLIENLVFHLATMYPDTPAWVAEHIRKAETQIAYAHGDEERRGYVDNLVGYTTIEYEHDLRKRSVFAAGHEQVRQHAAGLLNAGAPQDKVLGILSDTVEWRAYRIASVVERDGKLRPEDVELEEIERLDLSLDDPPRPERLLDFLSKHLGREGARVLAAETIADDLGFGSRFRERHLPGLATVVADALDERPAYADVIRRLWSELAGYIDRPSSESFDQDMYVNELYVVTLAKLLCANVLAGTALHSNRRELNAILDGGFFRARGLDNLVEYDYFGWLNADPYVARLLPIAEQMQRGLRSFDFESPTAEDLFGRTMAQLANRYQRLLLGQEWTPPWLAARMARKLLDSLPAGERPRFVDICCGSGSMLVEVVKLAAAESTASGNAAIDELTEVATGFDLDPLAVLLAKVNWVVATRGRLGPLDGTRPVSIPIYHADSMFAKTPIGSPTDADDGDAHSLLLAGRPVDLPSFLIAPERRALFDRALDVAHGVATAATEQPGRALEPDEIDGAVTEALRTTDDDLDTDELARVQAFIEQLTQALRDLEDADLNGIWSFVLRNTYRPGLLRGQFNGLITNPPWLAMSKLADNPYKEVLQRRAAAYGIRPPGAAHLHTELATTFLLHAVDRYLAPGSVIACVLPETVLNGYHHELFRRGGYARADTPVELDVDELWRVDHGTFKNEAIVLFGHRRRWTATAGIAGQVVSRQTTRDTEFHTVRLADIRTAWSDAEDAGDTDGWFAAMPFRQGADLMPRTAVFHETKGSANGLTRLEPIDTATSENAYLLTGSKLCPDFRVSPTTVPSRLVYDALISKHLVPFDIGEPAPALLPFEHRDGAPWRTLSTVELATSSNAQAVFGDILQALDAEKGPGLGLADYQSAIDTRRKLSTQLFAEETGYLVVYGAGGGRVAAAHAPLARYDVARLVIDQTLYWTIVDDETAALYTVGAFNSAAMDSLIEEFQARGAFGRRHIHKLPATVTPPFDPAQAAHAAVARSTATLLSEFAELRDEPSVARLLDPNRSLGWRRRQMRQEVIERLPAYASYAEACAALFAI